jgi:Tfp pilus assembly protein PilN
MVGVNLIPSEMLIRHRLMRRLQGWVIVGVALAGATLVPVAVEGRQQAQIERMRASVAEVETKLRSVRGEVASTAQTVLDLDAELARAGALRTKRSWSGLLALLSESLPPQVWLTSLATDPPQPVSGHGTVPAVGKAPEEAKTGGKGIVIVLEAPTALRLEGYALDHVGLLDLITELKDSGSFATVSLVNAGMEPVLGGRAVHFVLACEW